MKSVNSHIDKRVETLAQVRETVQKKTFVRWVNMGLSKGDQIGDLFEDFRSGVLLIKLINILSQSNLQPERGKLEIHHRSNIGRALAALSTVDPHHGISISAIYEGTPKLTLALVWHLILKYSHLHQRDMKGVSAEVQCKNWCNKHAEGYAGLENIDKDFIGTWLSGLVLPAIINRNAPELLDYVDIYRNKTPEERFEIAFGVVENHYNVPRLLDVEDMTRRHVDDQSVLTYLMAVNKEMPKDIPESPPPIITELKQQILKESQIIEEEEETNDHTMEEETDNLTLEEVDLEWEEEDLTPVEEAPLPRIMEEREKTLATAPEQGGEDSGLEDSPPIPREEHTRCRDRDVSSQRGSTITLDSEADYVSATSSPVSGSLRFLNDLSPDSSELAASPPGAEAVSMETMVETRRQPIAELEEHLTDITDLPENFPVTKSNLAELKEIFKERAGQCCVLQKQINLQLNWKQDRDKRADLHRLLSQTGRFDDALKGATVELDLFMGSLVELETAVERCEEFANIAEGYLEEETTPGSAEEAERKLAEFRGLRGELEEEQRNLECASRSLVRSIPKIIPLSIYEQQKSVTMAQNRLSDFEGVISGTVETLSFLATRLPSVEEKLSEADELLTRIENDVQQHIEKVTGNLENLEIQLDRLTTYLVAIDNLFSPIEMFSSEFNLEHLKGEWKELNERANRSRYKISELLEEEECLSGEVVAISDWADTLETFLQRKMKPVETSKQLKEVQGKWQEVGQDLARKSVEIEELLRNEHTPDERAMSPLDTDTLLQLRNQLAGLQGSLQTRRDLLQRAHHDWRQVECQIAGLSRSISGMIPGGREVVPDGAWAVRAMVNFIDTLVEAEGELVGQGAGLQSLVANIAELPTVIVEASEAVKQRDSLLNKHMVLCKRASNKRLKFQRICIKLEPVLPFLREAHLDKLKWLYNQPLLDSDVQRDKATNSLVALLKNPTEPRNVPVSQYWHIAKTIAPEKVPYMLLHLVMFAVGPWGLGCASDRPTMISLYTPDFRI